MRQCSSSLYQFVPALHCVCGTWTKTCGETRPNHSCFTGGQWQPRNEWSGHDTYSSDRCIKDDNKVTSFLQAHFATLPWNAKVSLDVCTCLLSFEVTDDDWHLEKKVSDVRRASQNQTIRASPVGRQQKARQKKKKDSFVYLLQMSWANKVCLWSCHENHFHLLSPRNYHCIFPFNNLKLAHTREHTRYSS